MIKHVGYKYRIYPTEKQKEKIIRNLAGARIVYNTALALKDSHYKKFKENKKVSFNDFYSKHPWLKECDSCAIGHAARNLEMAYKIFFQKRAKHPVFKKKSFACSYQTRGTTQKSGICSIRIENNKIRLPKIGGVKIKLHRGLPAGSIIKTVTVSRNIAGQFYVSLCLEFEANEIIPSIPNKSSFLGLDMAMHGLFVSSDEGFSFNYSDAYKNNEKKLIKLQKALSRKNRGSNNYYKWKNKLAKLHAHIVNMQDHELNQISSYIADNYDAVCVEDIDLRAMSKKKKGKKFSFGKSVRNNSFGKFRLMLQNKLEERGKLFIKIPKYYASSQICHKCGYQNPEIKNLHIRSWACPECGCVHDRDINAAINIRNKGYSMYIANSV